MTLTFRTFFVRFFQNRRPSVDVLVMGCAPNIVDQDTISSARRGDRDALAALWRTHQAPLIRYLRTKRVRQPEDIASQVWIDVAGSIARFAGDGNDFRAWLFTIAHRRSVDEVRRAIRQPEVVDDGPGEFEADRRSEDRWDAGSALERSITTVQQLPPDMAEAVMLRVVYDMDIADVAGVMQRSEGNVRVLVHRGLKKLQVLLTERRYSDVPVSIVS